MRGSRRQSGFGHKTFESLGLKRPHRTVEQQKAIVRAQQERLAAHQGEPFADFCDRQRRRIRARPLPCYRDRTQYFEEELPITQQLAAGMIELQLECRK